MTVLSPLELLRGMFAAAVRSAQPEFCLPPWLPEPPPGMARTVVVGAGKAAAAMAHALETHWPAYADLQGMVVTRYGYSVSCERIEIIEASHPVPDQAGLVAAQRMLGLVTNLTSQDLVIALISGGGSALMSLPMPGMTLGQKQELHRSLLKSGATIREMNCVRRHFSGIKGGRLGAACYPARVVVLLISDVPGDDPVDIASGPLVADPTTCADALEIVRRYGLELPELARAGLQDGSWESPKPGDFRLERVITQLVATPQKALEAAAEMASAAGITPLILGDSLEGEARTVGQMMAGIARQVVRHGQPAARPCVLLSGGETTVTVRGEGSGGRNVEFLLALAMGLESCPGVYAVAADTDGVDGMEEVAGAFVTPTTLERAWNQRINPRIALECNDGHGFFAALGDRLISGPTRTNVNDFRAVLVL